MAKLFWKYTLSISDYKA